MSYAVRELAFLELGAHLNHRGYSFEAGAYGQAAIHLALLDETGAYAGRPVAEHLPASELEPYALGASRCRSARASACVLFG